MARNSKNKNKQTIESNKGVVASIEEKVVVEKASAEENKVKPEEKIASPSKISHNIMVNSNGGFGDKLVRNFI